MSLSGKTIRKIREAIKSAFPNRDELIMMLRMELNIDEAEVPNDSNYNIVVFKLVKQLASQGRILELIKGALNEKPGNPNLQELAQEINTIDFYFSAQPLRKFFPYFLISIIVSLIVSLLVLLVAIIFFGLGKPIVVPPESKPSTNIVIVDSTAGWQDSGIKLKKNDTVHFEVSGRIHLAIRQIVNLAEFAKPLIIEKMSDEELKLVPGILYKEDVQKLRQKYPLPEINSKNTFYRKWTGSKGDEGANSDILERCRINYKSPWGQLFATVFSKETIFSEKSDPLDVLNNAQISPSKLTIVDNGTGSNTIAFNKEGKLAFIINEAVVSPHSPFPECKKYYEKLEYQARHPKQEKHKLDLESIPLIWFADNVGSFRVKVTVETQASASPQSGV